MPYKNGTIPPNKHVWTKKEIGFIRSNFFQMTNQQLADALGLKLTLVRMQCYQMGLKRMDLEYWTEEQVDFLKEHYRIIGDTELAELFNQKWHKQKGWSKKHIEKKRRYLNLKRTAEEMSAIKKRNVDNGCFALCAVKRWLATGVAQEGEIRYWRSSSGRPFPCIKINGTFVHWNRWAWEQVHGPVPKGLNVVFKNNDRGKLTVGNLELITNAELARRNSMLSSHGLSDNYVAGILTHGNKELRDAIKTDKAFIDLKRKQLLLNRTINESEKIADEA